MSPQTYKTAEPSVDDDLWQRMQVLYLRICSVGDEIYSAGSGVGVLHKRIDALESLVSDLRREFELLKTDLCRGVEEGG